MNPHNSLSSVGEFVAHRVCLFIEDVSDLSRLSQTSRRMYVSVRNLPERRGDQRVVSSDDVSLKDMFYWCRLGLSIAVPKGKMRHFCSKRKSGVLHGMSDEQVGLLRVHWLLVSADVKAKTILNTIGKFRSVSVEYDGACNLDAVVSSLGTVHALDFSNCNSLTDVSALGNVHTLNLHYCDSLTDVSALGNVHTLDLRGCESVIITDMSALGNAVCLFRQKY